MPSARSLGLIFSDEDADLYERKFTFDRHGYARGKVNQRDTFAHSVVVERMLGRKGNNREVVDHIDRNKLNNRRDNLRLVSKSVNGTNSRLGKNNTTGVKGLTYRASLDRWVWHFSFNGRAYQGSRRTREEALVTLLKRRREAGYDAGVATHELNS